MAYPPYSGYAISIRLGERYTLRELWRVIYASRALASGIRSAIWRIEYASEQNKYKTDRQDLSLCRSFWITAEFYKAHRHYLPKSRRRGKAGHPLCRSPRGHLPILLRPRAHRQYRISCRLPLLLRRARAHSRLLC